MFILKEVLMNVRNLVILCALLSPLISLSEESILINGKPVECKKEAYNCPSYKGKKVWKRLNNCDEVRIVWNTCSGDVHGLDRDNDGKPCEKDCDL